MLANPHTSRATSFYQPTYTLDLTGVVCPINYVKTKLKLEEEVKSGEVLAVILDKGMPIKSVPPSIEKDGHTVLAIEPVGEQFRMLIRKQT